jgi:hypothetical protein
VKGFRLKPYVPRESDEQKALTRWLDRFLPPFSYFHPQNETPGAGRRAMIWRVNQKARGVKAGVPDIVIVQPPPKFPELRASAIELKRQKGGKLADTQLAWLQSLTGYGWATICAAGADEAIEWLKYLGYGR